MDLERWKQVDSLLQSVLERQPEEREAFLRQACAGDKTLEREVQSLLTLERQAGSFLQSPVMEADQPAIQDAPQLLEDLTLTELTVGASLGPYSIESKLGEGGMGQVFRALDTRLGRTVAIKTTREQFSARFEREARAISSLNHPNICTLHDVGPNYLVMELVEGDTVATWLKSGPLPVKTALLYASQILAGLAEAHSKGVVHRDLKPANIMIAKSGIKILDFGLAKSGHDETVTGSHLVLGTPAYMAPEQRQGKTADARSDIYSFGCVLYEMLTGARLSSGRRRIASRKLERIVGRCLEEDPARRWQSASELQRELATVTLPRRWTRAAAVATAILVMSAAAYFAFRRPAKLTAKDTLVLAEFENKTGDPVFDQTLRQGLTVQLEQSPFLSLVSDQRTQQVLRFMNRPPETRLTPEISREICERTGSSAVLEGSIAALGSQYILWLRARNCRTGEVLAEEQAQAERKERVLQALSGIAIQMRTRLGESLASVQEHSTALEEATTSSLEALKAYSAAQIALFAHGSAAAIPHFQHAIAIDPQFAMAHAYLGFRWSSMGQTDQGADEVRIAYALRDRVSDRERRFILMLYDRQVTGNLQKELQTLESWAQTYPRDAYARGILGGWASFGTGQYERGIQAAQEAIRLDGTVPFPYATIAIHNLCLNRFAEAADSLRLGAERKFEIPEFLVNRYYLAFLKGDQAGMKREIARAPEEHAEDQISHHQALVLARSGRMGQARTMWERAIASAQQAGNRETAAIYRAAEAVCEAHCGNWSEARKRARAALEVAKGRDIEYAAAFALALSGDGSESLRLAAGLEKRFSEDTPVLFEYLPTLHALSALAARAPLDAVKRLERAIPYDFAMPGTVLFAKFGGLYTVYVRGQAYLAAGRGQEAAAEFQKILDHRGIVLADPVGALAHLQLGRAYVVSGDRIKARSAYQDFLAIWKDADPDIPILKQAKAEYAKLQ